MSFIFQAAFLGLISLLNHYRIHTGDAIVLRRREVHKTVVCLSREDSKRVLSPTSVGEGQYVCHTIQVLASHHMSSGEVAV
jgi:hypothetical protein